MKICNKCKIEKPFTEFFKDKNNLTDGHYSICKDCKTAGTLEQRKNNREHYNKTQRNYQKRLTANQRYGFEIKRRYGCTIEQYNEMLVAQGGACAICKKLHDPATKRGRLYVDHCHITGEIRALLCNNCNCLLGYSNDDTRVLMEAVAYIVRHRKS